MKINRHFCLVRLKRWWYAGCWTIWIVLPLTGYAFKKYTRYDSLAQPLILLHNRSDINYIYLRYADILLTYAEARNERLVRPDQAVYDALNEIRQRPGVQIRFMMSPVPIRGKRCGN